ncbi:hypothetical protein L9F63_009084, partial [Diploptera punctata]
TTSSVPPGTKPPPGSHLLPTVTSQGKHHRSGAPPLPGGHTVPGPGPGVGVGVPPTQPPSGSGRSFAAALRNLAKQAVPPAERENEGDPAQAPRQVSPKRGPPPLVRGGTSPPPSAGQDNRKDRSSSGHEQPVSRGGSSRPADDGPLYTGTSGRSSGGGSVPAPGAEITRSGFQPYRPEESRLGAQHPPAPAPPPPPPFGIDPAAAAAYSPYHHGLYPPHLQHAYRCGMLRPPMFPPIPSYPLYGLRYSPEMIPSPIGLISPLMNERSKGTSRHLNYVCKSQCLQAKPDPLSSQMHYQPWISTLAPSFCFSNNSI